MEEPGLERYRFGVLTVSDSRTSETDESGPVVQDELQQLGVIQIESAITTDDLDSIHAALLELCSRCDVVLTTGGTGFGPRDNTPEATSTILERRADNVSDYIRQEGNAQTPLAHLSRAVAGTRGSTLIVNLPGSPKGARESVSALALLLPHILRMMSGDTAH